MKKYVKPELFLEEFELSQSVAACGWDLQQNTRETCIAIPDEVLNAPMVGYDIKLFVKGEEAVSECNVDDEGYCYQVATDDDVIRVFQS